MKIISFTIALTIFSIPIITVTTDNLTTDQFTDTSKDPSMSPPVLTCPNLNFTLPIIMIPSTSDKINVNFECDKGYTLKGSISVTCLANGAWKYNDSNEPSCEWKGIMESIIKSAIANPSLVIVPGGVSFDIMYDLKEDEFKEITLTKSDNLDEVLFTFTHAGKKTKSLNGIGPRISDLSNHQIIHIDNTIKGDEGDYTVKVVTKDGKYDIANIYLGIRDSGGKDKNLLLSGVMPDYWVNSTLVAICDLQQLLNPIELKFLINNKIINEPYISRMYEEITYNQRYDVYRQLEITLTKEYIKNSRVKITCVAMENNNPVKETSETAIVSYPRNFCGYDEAKKILQ